jgi:hypothetical protein
MENTTELQHMENPNPIDRKDMLYKSEIWNELYATHVPV